MDLLPLNETTHLKPQIKSQDVSLSDQQLSFDDLLEIEDATAKKAQIPYVDYESINPRKFQFPQKRFFILSVAAHVLMIVYAVTIVVEKMQKPEIVEVSFISDSALPPAPTSYAIEEKAPAPEPKKDPVEDVATNVVKTSTAKKANAKSAKVATPPIKAAAKSVSAAQTKSAKAPVKAEPLATISDIAIPTLSDVSDHPAQNFSTKEIESDFDKIDESDNEKIMAAVQDDTKMLDESISDLEQTSSAIAGEESNVDEVAQAQLQNLKKQKEQLKQAKNAAKAGSPNGRPTIVSSQSAGTGNDESASSTKSSASGIGSESEGVVRRLEDLRQKPGNPRPTYDVADRMNGLSGTIIFNAYVTKEGNLTLFRLIQSTGHRNLDRKTLLALKNWKFYPGQEGWVELPFKWDLKGGVQQKPTLLKRK